VEHRTELRWEVATLAGSRLGLRSEWAGGWLGDKHSRANGGRSDTAAKECPASQCMGLANLASD